MPDKINFDFRGQLSPLASEQRLCFYEFLAHDLTVAIRCVWTNDDLSADQKVDQMKWINEILHNATSAISCLSHRTHEWSDEDFGSMVQHWAAQNPAIGHLIDWHLGRSIKYAIAKRASQE